MNRFLLRASWVIAGFFMLAPLSRSFAEPSSHHALVCSINGPSVSCVDQLDNYMVTPLAGYSYTWSVPAGGTAAPLTGPSTMVNWTAAGTWLVTLTETAPGGGVSTCTKVVTVHLRPTPAIFTDFISDCPDRKGETKTVIADKKDDCWVVCENMTVNYWTDVTPGHTYNWVVVGGTPTTGTGPNISVTWGPAGSGMIILTETSPGGCSETVEQCVHIVESPNAWFLFNGQDPTSPLVICNGAVVYFDDQSTGGAFWLWDFGDGTTSTAQDPSHTYPGPGTYNGTLTVKNECGCTSTLPFQVIVKDEVSPVIGCISTVCLKDCAFYSVSNISNCPGASIDWSIHGGKIINNPTPGSVNVVWDDNDGFIAANGYGEICVKISGCPGLCDGEVCVRVPVIHQVSISGDLVVCVGDPVTYSVPIQPGINEPGGTPDGVNFDWSVSGGTIISSYPYSNSITVVWNSPGTGTVTLGEYENYLTDSKCDFKPDPITVTIKPKFDIYPPTAKICVGDSQTFNLSGVGPFDWTETGPGGLVGPVSTGNSYTSSPALPGTYAISAQSTSGAYCNVTPTAVLEVLPNPAPPTGTLIGDTTVCLNAPYVYTLSNIAPPGTILVWSITGGTLYGGAGQTVTAQWNGIGPMTLSVHTRSTVEPFCESAPISFSIYEYSPPANFVTGDDTVCINEIHTYYITGLSNYTDLHWTVVPDTAGSVTSGQGSGTVQVQFNNTVPATAQVICTATVCGSPVSSAFTVVINQVPAYAIGVPAHACQYETVYPVITPGYGVGSVSWDFGDGVTSGLTAPAHAWSSTGTYQITAQVHMNICGNPTVTTGTTINIDPVPVAYVTASNGFVLCAPLVTSTTLTVATQFFCHYEWSTSPADTLPYITVSTPGYYSVTATAPGTNCTAVVTVHVDTCYAGGCIPGTLPWTFTSSENCDSYTFTPNGSGGSTFVGWDFGDGDTDGTAGVVTHVYDHPGYYQVTLISIDPVNGCTLYDVHTVSVKFKGNSTAQFDCSGGSMVTTLIDLSEYLPGYATTPTWLDSGSPIGTGSTFPTSLTPGLHYIQVQVVVPGTGQVCTSPIDTIDVPGMPVAMFTAATPKCEGVPVHFNNTSTGGGLTSFDWDFGDGSGSGLTAPDRAYDAPPLSYIVTLTVSNDWGCSDTYSASVSIDSLHPAPVLSIAPAATVCEGTPVTITASGSLPGPVSYSWYNAAASGVILQGPSALNTYGVTSSGLYGVSATDNHGCAYNVLAPNPVVILPPPYVQITGATDYCIGDVIHMSADIGGGFTYAWGYSVPGGVSISGPDIYQNASAAGTYTYTVTITDNASGCTNSGTISVIVHAGVTGLSIASSAACAPATLTASATGAVQFNWSTGDVGVSTIALQEGYYTVVASDAFGCTAKADYYLDGRPDLSNVMTGCYEYCDKVTWQATLCSGCTYQWTLNGTPIPGETNPTIDITNSGVYTVIVSNGPGCETESDPIDISIALTPDLCHECKVEIGKDAFKCVGIDPGTGLPIYEFWIQVHNYAGALYGLMASSSLGTITLIDPASGYLPGGGAVTTVHGYLVWDGGAMDGCISFLGFLSADCQEEKKCEFRWCGQLPKCCEGDCDFKIRHAQVTCIGNGFYTLTLGLENYSCDLFNLYVQTPYGTYPLSPSTLVGGTGMTMTTVIFSPVGSLPFTVCGRRFDGKWCCIDGKIELPECHNIHCQMEIQVKDVVCTGYDADGYPVYHFSLTVYGAPAGSTFYILPAQAGLVSGVTASSFGGGYTVQGTYTDHSFKDGFCFTVLTIAPGPPPEYCKGKFCMHAPPCGKGKPVERSAETGNPQNAGTAIDFDLVPNPATNEVTITGLDGNTAISQVKVCDLTGRSVELRPTGSTLRLDVTDLPSGVYLVTVTSAGGVPSSRKLMIIK